MKFYTAFLFNSWDASLHCTHQYFGELNRNDLRWVAEMVHRCTVMQCRPFAPNVIFRKEEFFGEPDNKVRVLLADDPKEFDHWSDLKEIFQSDPLFKDKYPFNPHVTTSYEEIHFPLTHYGLCTGKRVLHAWPLINLPKETDK